MTCNRLVKGVFVAVAVWGIFAGTAGAAEEKAKDIIGTWSLKYDPGDGDHKATLTVTQEKSGLKGKFEDGDRKFEVTKIEYKDGKLTFTTRTERDGEKATATFEGKVKGDTIEGEGSWEYQGMSGSFPFTGKREAEKPRADAPSAVAVPGKPSLSLGSYDIGPLGYQVEEFFVSGIASSYKLKGEATEDGKWNAVPTRTAPYTTRIVVVRPTDSAKFSGTAVVEWLNVTGGFDMPVEWNMVHREILRRGHAYVGVSAQKVGVEGGRGAMRSELAPLKKADPVRYGSLSHPGDAFAYDIFSQTGRLVKDAAASKVLGPLVPRRVIGVGESQSAFFLTTYVTAVDPVARIYDGFLIHARFGPAAPLDDTPALAAIGGSAKSVKLRPDLRVPVMTVLAESDVLGWPPLKGYHAARQADTDRLRVWEIAGAAHADNYVITAGYIDSGSLPLEKLAAALAPTRNSLGNKLAEPMNFGPQQHYVVQAALWQLDRWLQKGQAPPKVPALRLSEDKPPKLVTDANGLAEGGVRTPWVDVPTARLTGAGSMVGVGRPFDGATLERLYPGGKGEYLKKFEASLDTAIKAGFILPDDKAEIMGLAALGFTRKDGDLTTSEGVASEDKKAGREIALYPGAAPGSEKWDWSERSTTSPTGLPMAMDVVRPVLLHYPAEKGKAVGTAMIVAPGGGFRVLMMSYEGEDIARRLNAMGIDAFVLKYRLLYTGPGAPPRPAGRAATPAERPRRFTVTGSYKAQAGQDMIALAADDGRQAVRLVRQRAGEFGVRPNRVGMIGFSAGGVVTSEAVFGPAQTRPDFAASIYGVGEIKEVPNPAPPLFLASAADDALAAGRTVELFTAYRKGKGLAELHIFQMGAHGFVNKGGGADHFMDRLEEWLRVNKLLSKAEASATAPVSPPASAKTVTDAGGKVIPIWPDRAPGSEDWTQKEVEYRNEWDKKTMVRNVTAPTLTAFLPDPSIATGAAVVICPGGGFRFLSWQSEGTEVAQWLQARGVAAFVLKYRLIKTAASEEEFRKEMAAFFASLANRRDRPSADNAPKRETPKDQAKPSEASRRAIPEDMRRIGTLAIADGKQAIQVVRRHAVEWGIKPDRIGIMGFSAGGMVTMGVVMDHDKESRPNFAAPIYGGGTGGAKVPEDAPPLFILCASDDQLAAMGSARLYSEWKAAGRPVELHLFEKGGHGFGMTPKGLPVDRWIERYGDWLGQRGLIKAAAPRR